MALRGRFKYIEGSAAFGDEEGLLFDLEAGPGETENLRTSRPEVAAELRGALDTYVTTLRPGTPRHQETRQTISPFPGDESRIELSEERKEKLRALGYFR